MKYLTNLITTIIIAFLLGVIAIFSIQNITEVSLKLLIFKSIKLPVGVLLSFCMGGGMILGSLAPLLWKCSNKKSSSSKKNYHKVDDFSF